MPIYDTTCANCFYEGRENIRIAELDAWDAAAICPQCQSAKRAYHRFIKSAPSLKETKARKSKMSVTDYETMRHQQSKTTNRDQILEARETVKSGKFEGLD